jgi:sterol desaturase/sphingolipid hydroxylase (fatty acid hydroxylase superfamily)
MVIQSILVVLVFLLLVEKLAPAVDYKDVPNWRTRAILINLLAVGSVQLFDLGFSQVIPNMSVIEVSEMTPAPVAGLLGFMWATLGTYWWHRAMHKSDFLWRWFHQLHHSPRRIEVVGALYTHPLNIISMSFVLTLMTQFIGLSAEALLWLSLILGVVTLFTHANINVPRWIGYFIQTPNMHRFHHEYQKHRNNYSEFVLWDVLFGTYKNSGGRPDHFGFGSDKERNLRAIFTGKDVNINSTSGDSRPELANAFPSSG